MAGITLAQAEEKLSQYMEAAEKLAKKQTYSIDGRTLSYANLADVQNMIDYWDMKCRRLSRGRKGNITARRITAID